MKKRLNKRLVYAICSAVIALSLIVGGVFAWVDNSQHRSNVITGGGLHDPPGVILVEDFEEPEDPRVGADITKEVWVRNIGESFVFVRLQLKEFMEIAKVSYEYSEEFLLVDRDGRFVSSAGTSAADLAAFKLALDNMGLVYEDSQIVTLRAYGDSVDRFYLATNEHTNINGKYGTRLMLDYNQDAPRSLVEGVQRGQYEVSNDHRNNPTSECLYTPHVWHGPAINDCGHGECLDGFGFHDYFEWTMGPSLILLSEWDGHPVAAWILDDISDEKDQGWAYWGEALRPADSTSRILESIKLIQQPAGPYYYAIHVDMQAAAIYQLSANFDGMPQKIEDSYRGNIGFAISAPVQSAPQGGNVRFQARWNGEAIPAADVTWTVSVIDAAHRALDTGFNTPGVLTLGTAQPTGRLLVTATYDSPEGLKTSQYVINVRQRA